MLLKVDVLRRATLTINATETIDFPFRTHMM